MADAMFGRLSKLICASTGANKDIPSSESLSLALAVLVDMAAMMSDVCRTRTQDNGISSARKDFLVHGLSTMGKQCSKVCFVVVRLAYKERC